MYEDDTSSASHQTGDDRSSESSTPANLHDIRINRFLFDKDEAIGDVPDRGKSDNTVLQATETPLHNLILSKSNDEDAYNTLCSGTISWREHLNTRFPNDLKTALHMAIEKRFRRVAYLLLDSEADVNIQDAEGAQPLHRACEAGDKDLVISLLDRKAETKHAAFNGWWPLHFACSSGLEEVIHRLLGPGKWIIDKVEIGEGWTPLNIATYFQHEKVVEVLLREGARLEIEDSTGWTPFMTAVKRNNYDILNTLLDHSSANKDAIDQADGEGRTVFMNLFADTPRVLRLFPRVRQVVDKFRELKVAVDVTDNEGRTVLHHAIRYAVDIKDPWPAFKVLESLLLVDAHGVTAFDGVFDKDVMDALQPILNSLVARLGSETKILHWSAYSANRHHVAKSILSKSRPLDTAFQSLNPEEWTIIEWAIHHRLPRLLWIAVSTLSTRGPGSLADKTIDIRKARSTGKRLLKLLKDNVSIPTSTSQHGIGIKKKDNQETGSIEEDAGDERNILQDMDDILDFFYVEKSKRPAETIDISQPDSGMTQSSMEFYAAVVSMRQDKTELRRYVKSRSVQEVLYAQTPIETMAETDRRLNKRLSGADYVAAPTGHEYTEFTWVHFPSTNVSSRYSTNYVQSDADQA